MSESQFHLFGRRRFLPLFVTQFLGALNDNLFKNALAVLILFRLAEQDGLNGQVLATAAAGLFMAPFFLFSATAGQVSDKFDKSRVIAWIKAGEILVMGLGAAAIWFGDVPGMLASLFLMGLQSTFFSPAKYSVLPEHLRADELVGGNALIETGTFLAILIGTILGGLLILGDAGVETVSVAVVAIAALGWMASLAIPKAAAKAPDLRINPNILAETLRTIRLAGTDVKIGRAILGISWFWLVGLLFLSQFPALAKSVLSADETVVTLFLTIFSIGIGVGSLLCDRLLKGEVTAKYVPFAALGMTVFMLDLSFALEPTVDSTQLVGALAFLSEPANWRVLVDLLGISICGGLFIVPLYALLQTRADEQARARFIASNNIINAGFMVVGTFGAVAMLALGASVIDVFLVAGVLNGIVTLYICKLLPQEPIRALVASWFKLFYRVEIKGLEHLKSLGDRAVIVPNHVSYIDGMLLATFLPGKLTFAVDTFAARGFWSRLVLSWVDAFTVDPTNPMAVKSLVERVRAGRRCVIFPEGRLTVTGGLMKVNEGPGMIADKADAPIVPVRIDGAQYTAFSRLKGKFRLRWFPKITITILPPRRFDLPEGLTARQRRHQAALKLYDVMSDMVFETEDRQRTLFEALLDARAIHGGKHPIAEDPAREPLTYDRLILGSLTLGRKLARLGSPGNRIGVMLPNSLAAVATFFGLQAHGRVPAMLNFSTGAAALRAAASAATLKTVVTSRRFVEAASLEPLIDALSETTEIVYLEDVKASISVFDKLRAIVTRPFARGNHGKLGLSSQDPAVVLFTSGSEGTPKGVVLSHENLLANCHQLAARVDFNPTDKVFNALPVFHSFGLTGGTLLPILGGVKTFLYPSPLHYRIVPALVYDTDATILFGTDTFLAGYARTAHDYDFHAVRFVFAGAEKVKDETRRVWSDRFGLRVLEGYGTTETAPVLAANTPMNAKSGTVGRLMPGIDATLIPVPGIDTGGRLLVRGPNVMLGYLKADAPGVLEPCEDGTYDTGDIVSIDDEGFVTIQGRAKRFAKIGGEMISLAAVEAAAASLWPDALHAAVSVPDPQKGERIVLVTDQSDAARDAFLAHAREAGLPELAVPKDIKRIDAVPILGTGKIDYVGAAKLAA